MIDRGSEPQIPGRLFDPLVSRTVISFGAW
jgi:hypothetical protein